MRLRTPLSFLLLGGLLFAQAAPQPLMLDPSSAQQGSTVEVTVNGPSLSPNGTVEFVPPLNVSNMRSAADRRLQFTLQIPATAAIGPYMFVYTPADQRGGTMLQEANAFTVLPAPPPRPAVGIRSITPPQITAGESTPVDIVGTGFAPGAQLSFSGSGVTGQVIGVSASGDGMNALLTAAASAAPGPRNVVVTNTDGSNNANAPGQITVVPAPPPPPRVVMIRSITPSQINAGETTQVDFLGTGFAPGAQLSFSGSGISGPVIGVSASGDGMTAILTAAASAAPGPRNVVVTNTDGSNNANAPGQITVVPAPPPPPRVVFIRSITPSQINAGETTQVDFLGSGFAPGAQLSFSGSGISGPVIGVSASGDGMTAILTAAASAAPGPRNVVVTNTDGSSNSNQSPPAQITVIARPVPPPPPPPPTPTPQPPTPTPQPPTPPPQPPPPTPQPPTPPPQPPTPPPQPPTPPPQPPTPTPQPPTPTPQPPTPPPVVPPKIPPTEVLVKPRIDSVAPAELQPGKSYKLSMLGKNLSPGTSITFGKDVTIVGVAMITSPTSATASVLVSPAALPGTIPAVASNAKGSSSGPGGVLIVVQTGKPAAKPPVTPVVQPKPKFKWKQPTGVIILDAPCDPDLLGSITCKDPVTLNDETSFVWHETNPGVAKFFIFEIVDGDGKELFSAQTSKLYFHLSAANLASLPRIETAPGIKVALKPPSTPPKGSPGTATKADAAKGVAPPAGGSSSIVLASLPPAPSPGNAIELTKAMDKAGPYAVKKGTDKAAVAGRKPQAGEVYWRVRGMANKIDEDTGSKLAEIIQAEDSAERAILLPFPPNGFNCDEGTPGSHLGTMIPLFFPSPYTYPVGKRPKPCPGDSLNVCSLADYAMVPDSARLDLTRIPFDIGQVGQLNSSAEVTFQNVFVDWGDGSEPKPLKVDGTLTGGKKQSLKSLRLDSPGGESKRLRHMYFNKDKDAEFVVYKIRVFSLADPDKNPPHKVASIGVTEAKPVGSLAMKGTGSQASPAASSPAAASSATPAASPSASADAGVAKTALSPHMFTIACAEVQVWNPWGVGADEPLYLLTASVVFPTDSDDDKTLIRAKTSKLMSKAGAPSAKGPPTPAPASKSAVPAKPGPGGSPVMKAGGVVPALDTGPTPEISDCSSAFKAAVMITYWGHGKVKLFWYLDDVLIESGVVPGELPPVSTADGEAGKKPYFHTMTSALPAVLQVAAHRLKVRAEVVEDMLPIVMIPSGGGSSKKSADAKVMLGPTQSSGTQVNVVVSKSNPSPPMSPSGPTFVVKIPEPAEPGSEAESPTRFYKVFDHKAKGLPCALRFLTVQTGIFEVTDLSTFNKSSSSTYSGSGMLKLLFPSDTGASLSVQPVKVNFANLTLAPTNEDDEDVLDVKSGSITQNVTTDPALSALGFTLRLTKVSLTAEKMAIDGDVGIHAGMGFTNATAADLPKWEFTNTSLHGDGDFHFAKAKAIETELGASQFKLQLSTADIDFTKKQGSKPTEQCSTPAGSDPEWQGIHVDGKLLPPATLEFGGKKLLNDYTFTNWGIGPGGLSVKLNDPGYTKQVSTSGVKIEAKGFKFTVCDGSFKSPSFGLDVTNAPLVVQKISGTITLDEFAQPHSSFPALNINQDWGNVKGKITNAALGYSAIIGNFAISINSHFAFEVKGKPAYEHDYDGILITLDGNVFAPNGDHYYSVADAGQARIAGYPMQVTALGVGNMPNGDIWFGFKGDVEVGEHAPNADDREAKFKLTKTTTASLGIVSYDGVVASFTWSPLDETDEAYQDFNYSSSEKDGVTIQEVHLEFDFPPSSKTVNVVADCYWEESVTGFRFIGTGTVTVADSFAIDIQALYGRKNNDSYWMVKAAVTLPSMIPFGSTGFGFNEIHGGLGLSVPISAYDLADLHDVVSDSSGNYSFSAGIGVGTLDSGFTVYCKGTLTVKMGGPDAGVRVSAAFWLLNSEHALPALAQVCIQYAGGAFDAGLTFHLDLAGIIILDAPSSGPDVCTQSAIQIHFGGSGDWHIWIGHPPLPLTATILIIEGKGYLTIDGVGIAMYNGITVDKQWSVSILGMDAYVKIKGGVEIEGGIEYSPFFIHGSFHGYIGLWAGVDVVFGCCDVHFMIDLMFSAEAPPVKVCGKVTVEISTPWPFDDIDVTVGPLCIGG